MSTVAVIGAGAIGGCVAAAAASCGHQVTLCVRTPIDQLVVEYETGPVTVDAEIATDPSTVSIVDWVLVATKSQDTASAAPWLSRLCGPSTVVVLLQNGLGQQDQLAPLKRVLPAVVYIAAERVSPGRVVHRSDSRIAVPAGSDGATFAALLRRSSVTVVQVEDFITECWRKVLGNVAANPITALTMRRMEVFQRPDIIELARALLTEAMTVARADGARLSDVDVDEMLDVYAQFNGDSGTSMLYDRVAGRELEHEAITGAVVSLAERYGIDVPLNRVILTLLRAAA